MRQPVNTASNLPFALTGAHMLALGVADARAWRRSSVATAELHSELQRFPLFSLANGAAQVWVAAGSFLFHGSFTRAGQRADMGAVYTVLLCPTVYVAQRLGLLGPGNAHAPFAAALACAGAWFTHNKWRIKSSRVVPVLVVLLALLQALWLAAGSGERQASLRRWLWGPQRRDRPAGMAWPLLLGAVVSIGIAFGALAETLCVVGLLTVPVCAGCTVRDMMLAGCSPRGAFQWHAAWHFAAAAALWLLYAFLRSERPRLADARGADTAERRGT